ncbi:MAG TPA: hypothetical protein PLV92_01110, partial [Pirellulaceae bacterium]|nr:hypothetical protein [Pirellulaceae bacterium]
LDLSLLKSLEQGSLTLQDGGTVAVPVLARIDGTSLSVTDGVSLDLPLVTTYEIGVDRGNEHRRLTADGIGSRIGLPNLQIVTGGRYYNTRLFITATNAGAIDLSQVRQLLDPSDGDGSYRSIDVSATGLGSRIELDSLIGFVDRTAYDFGSGMYSTLEAKAGGTVDAPQLAVLQGVNLELDGAGSLAISQITSLTSGRIEVTGGSRDFASLVDANDTEIVIQGVAVSMNQLTTLAAGSLDLSAGGTFAAPRLANIDDADVRVAGGVTLALPSVTRYSMEVEQANRHHSITASGVGSRLALSNVQTITTGRSYNNRVFINALDGAVVDLSAVRQIADPSEGDKSYRSIDVVADGADSRIELDSLTSFLDQNGYDFGTGMFSTLAARSGGVIDSPQLVSLYGVNLELNGGSSLPFEQISTFNSGRLLVTGAPRTLAALAHADDTDFVVQGVRLDLPNLTTAPFASVTLTGGARFVASSLEQIDGMAFDIAGGGVASLPAATRYSVDATGANLHRVWTVSGPGSRLELPAVTQIVGGEFYNTRWITTASDGGVIDLSRVVQLVDPLDGDTSYRTFTVTAADAGSRIDFSSLAAVVDRYGDSDNSTGLRSTLRETDGGQILTPASVYLVGAQIIRGGSTGQSIATASDEPPTNAVVPPQADAPPAADGDASQAVAATQNGALAHDIAGTQDIATTQDASDRTVRWVGGSGAWNLAANWSNGRVPTSSDDVVIDAAGTDLTIEIKSGDVVVRSLNSTESLTVADGASFTVLADSVVSGELTVRPGATLIARGVQAQLRSLGSTRIDGANLLAIDGGRLKLAAALSYDHAGTAANQHRTIRVEGLGAEIDLSGVREIRGGEYYNNRLFIQARGGGRLKFNSVVAVDDAVSGDTNYRSIEIVSDGRGSRIEFDSLVSLLDRNAYDFGNGIFSVLAVRSGGEITTPLLKSITGASVELGDGTLSLPELQRIYNSQVTLAGAGVQPFPKLIDASDTQLQIRGVRAEFPVLTTFERGQLTTNAGAEVVLPELRNISGLGLRANAGTRISVPLATIYEQGASAANFHRYIVADGVGSEIDLSHVDSIRGGEYYNNRLFIQALNGGRIRLDATLEIADSTTGDTSFRSIELLADGRGSRIDLPLLTAFVDNQAGDFNTSMYSALIALAGGVVDTPRLVTMRGVNLTLNPGTASSIAHLQRFTGGRLAVNGTNHLLPVLATADDSEFFVDAATLNLPELTSLEQGGATVGGGGRLNAPLLAKIDGSSWIIRDGAVVSLSTVEHYEVGATSGNQHRYFTVDGAGSRLEMPNLQGLGGGHYFNTRLFISALDGGVVDLSAVRQIADPTDGDGNFRSIDITASGAGSRVQLDQLRRIVDRTAYDLGYGMYSTLSATVGGVIAAPLLTDLQGVNLVLDRTGVLSTANWTQFTSGRISLTGVDRNFPSLANATDTELIVTSIHAGFPALTDLSSGGITLSGGGDLSAPNLKLIDGASISIRDNVTLALPAVEHYTLASDSGNQHRHISVDGQGSRLELPNLQTITGSRYYNNRLFIEAHNGALLDLSQATQILDPTDGDTNFRSIDVIADGPGSRIALDALESYRDRNGYDFGYGMFSTLAVRSGGRIDIPVLVDARGVNLEVSREGTLSTSQLARFTSGRIFVAGANRTFTLLADADDTDFVVKDATLDAPLLTTAVRGTMTLSDDAQFVAPLLARIDGMAFDLSEQSVATLPSATQFSSAQTGNDQHLRWSLIGEGARLALPGLRLIVGGEYYNDRLFVDVSGGAKLDLSHVVQIVDSPNGDTRYRAAVISSTDPGSNIDLSNLDSVVDRYSSTTDASGLYSELRQSNRGAISLPSNLLLEGAKSVRDGATAQSIESISPDSALESASSTAGGAPVGAPIGWIVGPDVAGPWPAGDFPSISSGTEPATPPADNGPSPWRATLALSNNSSSAATTQSADERTVRWLGGDGNWSSPSNWSAGRIPTADDDVIIDDIGRTSSIRIDAGEVVVRSLNSSENLEIATGASLNVLGDSTVSGSLVARPGATLAAFGPAAVLRATGSTDIDGANLYATLGGRLFLVNATTYEHAATSANQHRTVRAEGIGSTIDLSGVTAISGGGYYNVRLFITALSGGRIKLPAATTISDLTTGDTNYRSIDVVAEGLGSRIDLDALTSFEDRNGYDFGYGMYSTLAARDGADIHAPSLATLRGVNLEVDGPFSVGALTSITYSLVAISSGGTLTFTHLADASDSQVIVQRTRAEFPVLTSLERGSLKTKIGASVHLPQLSEIDGASLTAGAGTTISIPSATTYSHGATGGNIHRYLVAEGVGAVLDLSHVASIRGGDYYNNRIFIQAKNGGQVRLDAVATIADSTAGDTNYRSIDLLAEGAASHIELPSLNSYWDANAYDFGYGMYSTIAARDGGAIVAPNLTELRGVSLELDVDSNVAYAQFTTFTSGRLVLEGEKNWRFPALASADSTFVTVRGGNVELPALVQLRQGGLTMERGGSLTAALLEDIDGSNLKALSGSQLRLPNIVTYDHAATGGNVHRQFHAEGPGSEIDLPNLTIVRGGDYYNNRLFIETFAGGVIRLPAVVSIEDSAVGDTNYRSLDVTADGVDSRVYLDALTTIVDRNGYDFGYGMYSKLAATNGGSIVAPQLKALQGVDLELRGAGGFEYAQIESFRNGRLLVDVGASATRRFTSLVDARDTDFAVESGRVEFPLLTTLEFGSISLAAGVEIDVPLLQQIDGAAFSVGAGSIVRIPSATSYDHRGTGNDQHRRWRAEGAGAEIDLPALTTIQGGGYYNDRLFLEALGGGVLRLSNVASIA